MKINHILQAVFIPALALAVIASCERITDPGSEEHDQQEPVELQIQANLGTTTTVEQLSVEVTAADIPIPVIANLTITDTDSDGDFDRAEGTIVVPSGRERTFTARAFDLDGFVTHEGTTTTQVRPNDKAVRIPLFPKEVGVPIEVVVSAYSVSIDPTTAAIDPEDTQQFTATVMDASGEVVESPELTWASSNPAVATVDSSGLVRAQISGLTDIVVSYKGISAEAQLTVGEGSAVPANQPPVAQIDAVETTVGSPVIIDVLANDSDPDGDSLTIDSISDPANGVAAVNSGATITYTPDGGFSGEDSFEYTVSDGKGGTAIGMAKVTVTASGTMIAFTSYRDGNQEIYAMTSDGNGQTNLTENAGNDYRPIWSPDGTTIAFESDRSGNVDIYLMSRTGRGQTNLTGHPAADYGAVWSPDGSRIAFLSNRFSGFYPDIFVMNADGTGQTQLTENGIGFLRPGGATIVWSPDGTRIAFDSFRDGNYEIYVMNADGSGETRLTNHPAFDGVPVWSPVGNKIAFESARDGNYEIYVMNADGSGQDRLTALAEVNEGAIWSPDGEEISFVRYLENAEIYVMKADGSGLRNLTNSTRDDYAPAAWSPDGAKVLFESASVGFPSDYEIYVINADGSGTINLTNSPGTDVDPVWSP
ncbi:MAG TPA: Ig-like domain-containing protein [Longimicrobiaceae bacterium]|nr:Ig-like domain-containing protein [Longimicrobiaceae bacterium]